MTSQQVVKRRDAAASPRVQRKRDQRVRDIVTAAAQLFGEKGYEAVSLEDVAALLDVTKSSLYYYFAGKDDLIAATIDDLGQEWMQRLEHAASPAGARDATQRLRALIREHLKIAVQEQPGSLRLYLVPHAWPAPLADRIKTLRTQHDRVFRAVIEDGLRAGEFTVTDLNIVLQCMHASMTQAPTWCAHLPTTRRSRAIDGLVDTLMLLVGIRPPGDC